MKKMIKDNWYLVFVVLVCTVGAYLIAVITIADYNHAKTVKSPKEQCEDHNGIYMYGGFSSPNCVFPPKEVSK